ncbi:MAG: excinuclease ABC subunit UvrC [Holosporales bacterium]|jgi:excinuclease ABC subunit C|nr:excinuclease ABC subunit UvrC [Holosporales bacterium]
MQINVTELKRGQIAILTVAKSFPQSPGIYKMLDRDGNVLYIGKAKNLKNRVMSYTNVDELNYRIRRMVSNVHDVVFVVTNTESDAIFLEADLIHTVKPQYNVLLKESVPFASIGISKNHNFPRIWKHRGAKANDEYLGPFSSVKSVDEAIVNIQKIFQLRTCTDAVFEKRTRPCLQYDIKLCSAPCVGKILREEYLQAVQSSKEFLAGNLIRVMDFLKNEMLNASNNLNFEKAARYRDSIRRLANLSNIEKIKVGNMTDADVIAIYQPCHHTNKIENTDYEELRSESNYDSTECNNIAVSCIQILFIRNGLYLGGDSFILDKHANLSSPEENMANFLQQFYLNRTSPKRILINCIPTDVTLIQDAFQTRHHRKVCIEYPKEDLGIEWVTQALNNAIKQSQYELSKIMDFHENVQRLAKIFCLPHIPTRVEIYDNSHNQGSYAYGCMVVATHSGFDKKSYRKFSVSPRTSDLKQLGGDDYAMMTEMLTRRFKNAENLPDLIIIDGGAGQISAAIEVLTAYNIDIPIIGVAKGIDRNAGHERFFMPGQSPISLPYHDATLHFIQRLRDEAHRFAITTHRNAQSRNLVKSQLNEIVGVGQKRKKMLIKHFGSVQAIKNASIEELLQVDGINNTIAENIYSYFRQD